MKQDTSWDIGGSVPEPAVPTIAVKQVILALGYNHKKKEQRGLTKIIKLFSLLRSFRHPYSIMNRICVELKPFITLLLTQAK